jgi:cytoskeletal protein RodZ|tara:strand:- start:587 stop:811 length:225 start_codon:yes stop_codon:yes gene_type:complete
LLNPFNQKRIELNLSIEETAKKVFISPHVLEDLENGYYSNIPQPFLYYCAKNYANFLEIELPLIIKKTTPMNIK